MRQTKGYEVANCTQSAVTKNKTKSKKTSIKIQSLISFSVQCLLIINVLIMIILLFLCYLWVINIRNLFNDILCISWVSICIFIIILLCVNIHSFILSPFQNTYISITFEITSIMSPMSSWSSRTIGLKIVIETLTVFKIVDNGNSL